MPAFHLWLKKPPELAFDSPPDAVSLLMSALNYVLAVREYMRVDPCALVDNKFRDLLSLLVFLNLGALDRTPESLRAAVRVLAKSTRTDCQTRGVLHSLQLFLTFRGIMLSGLYVT